MVKNTNNINIYVKEKSKQLGIKSELIKDFKIRWNYTVLMCERFIEFRKIIDEITAYQANMTLSSQQINKI